MLVSPVPQPISTLVFPGTGTCAAKALPGACKILRYSDRRVSTS